MRVASALEMATYPGTRGVLVSEIPLLEMATYSRLLNESELLDFFIVFLKTRFIQKTTTTSKISKSKMGSKWLERRK